MPFQSTEPLTFPFQCSTGVVGRVLGVTEPSLDGSFVIILELELVCVAMVVVGKEMLSQGWVHAYVFKVQ